uniref:Putative gypsy-type retrotransposon protein n=1 Tax=Oryza sativa subsp. indica TaxID=39946 RepID=Q0P167_ORYSI|nr:putative gypsy-type retrotransposon protein [Oryza sativa Indica Group]AAZ06249.1 putative gypsy-type retrotransposon protein [Oryza sativa Indica Group]
MTDRRYAEGLSEDTLKDGPSGTRPEDRPELDLRRRPSHPPKWENPKSSKNKGIKGKGKADINVTERSNYNYRRPRAPGSNNFNKLMDGPCLYHLKLNHLAKDCHLLRWNTQ